MTSAAVISLVSDSRQAAAKDSEDIRGRDVVGADSKHLGSVEDLLIDEHHHKVRFMVVEHDGPHRAGRQRSIIPIEDITAVGVHYVHINHDEDHVLHGPAYNPELTTDERYLSSVYAHYGDIPYWGVGYGYPVYTWSPNAKAPSVTTRVHSAP